MHKVSVHCDPLTDDRSLLTNKEGLRFSYSGITYASDKG